MESRHPINNLVTFVVLERNIGINRISKQPFGHLKLKGATTGIEIDIHYDLEFNNDEYREFVLLGNLGKCDTPYEHLINAIHNLFKNPFVLDTKFGEVEDIWIIMSQKVAYVTEKRIAYILFRKAVESIHDEFSMPWAKGSGLYSDIQYTSNRIQPGIETEEDKELVYHVFHDENTGNYSRRLLELNVEVQYDPNRCPVTLSTGSKVHREHGTILVEVENSLWIGVIRLLHIPVTLSEERGLFLNTISGKNRHLILKAVKDLLSEANTETGRLLLTDWNNIKSYITL